MRKSPYVPNDEKGEGEWHFLPTMQCNNFCTIIDKIVHLGYSILPVFIYLCCETREWTTGIEDDAIETMISNFYEQHQGNRFEGDSFENQFTELINEYSIKRLPVLEFFMNQQVTTETEGVDEENPTEKIDTTGAAEGQVTTLEKFIYFWSFDCTDDVELSSTSTPYASYNGLTNEEQERVNKIKNAKYFVKATDG